MVISFLAGSYAFGGFRRTTYSYTCEICQQHWQRNTTMLWRVPFWWSGGEHLADDHEATYRGGGFSFRFWSWSGTAVGCGMHFHVSGSPADQSSQSADDVPDGE